MPVRFSDGVCTQRLPGLNTPSIYVCMDMYTYYCMYIYISYYIIYHIYNYQIYNIIPIHAHAQMVV